jgi:hypothetical protein
MAGGHRHAGGFLDRGEDVVTVTVDVGQDGISQPQDHQGEGDDEEGRGAPSKAEKDSRYGLDAASSGGGFCALL